MIKIFIYIINISFILSACSLDFRVYSLTSDRTLAPDSSSTEEASSLSYSLSKNYFSTTEIISIIPTISGNIDNFNITPTLPTGYNIDQKTGVIAGNSSSPTPPKTYTINATDSSGNQLSFSIDFEVIREYVVNTTSDLADQTPGDGVCQTSSSNCSLRAAIEESNNQLAGTLAQITLPSGTYGLVSQSLSISGRVIINGSDSSTTLVDANPDSSALSPAFELHPTSEVTIKGISIKNASVSPANGSITTGVGIKSLSTKLTLQNCEVSNNTASGGSSSVTVNGLGIFHSGGNFEMIGCIISNNTSTLSDPSAVSTGGGAHITAPSINIKNSTVSNNTLSMAIGTTKGGALAIYGSSLLDTVIVSGNQARNSGGAIVYGSYEAEIKNSTFTDNSGGSFIFGAQIYSPPGKKITISSSTFSTTINNEEIIYANTSDLNIKNSTFKCDTCTLVQLNNSTAYIEASTFSTDYYPIDFRLATGTLTIKSSILQSADKNCTSHANPVVSLGYNIFSDNTCATGDSRDSSNTNALLNPLANNGGSTMTISTNISSPAINFVPITECLSTDQRGQLRNGNFCDAGSYQH